MISLPTENTAGNEGINNPIHQRRHVRIICIGAGASGLLFAYKLQRSFDDFSLTIYEKNKGIAGTWFENKYPGCACDYPAHNYTYTFEPKPDWPSVYVSRSQICQYFEDFSAKYGLAKYCKTAHEVKRAAWNDQEGHWRVEVFELATGKTTVEDCEILINAAGVLNQSKWPDIPGLRDFQGQLVHSAKWDEGVELKGKSVGLIGNGSSGQQILETIQPIVGHLTSFIRQAAWTFGPFGPSPQRDYTPSETSTFKNDPSSLLALRKSNETRINSSFPCFLSSHPAQSALRAHLTAQMKSRLQASSALETLLIPTTGVGCRRPTPGVNYLSALTSPNVTIAPGPIARITPSGAVSASDPTTHHDLDVLICATGFNTTYMPRFPIFNGAGTNLQDAWSRERGGKPEAYFATAAAGWPNYLMFFGPGNPWSAGSFLAMTEVQAEYMLRLVDRYQSENWHSFTPKREVVDELMAHSKRVLKKTVWAEGCSSWYKQSSQKRHAEDAEAEHGADGDEDAAREAAAESLTLWPGSGLHFVEALAELRADDWDIRYKGNRFDWMGNGFSRTEEDPESDRAWYIRDRDDGPFLSREKRRRVRTRKGGRDGWGMAI